MTNNNNCENYPKCRNCINNIDCFTAGIITAPNPLLDVEVDNYNNVYKSDSIPYANNDFEVNKTVLHLIKWELEYRQKHSKNIDVEKIIYWYNSKFYASVTENDLSNIRY